MFLNAVELSAFGGFSDAGLLNTVTFTVVDYTQLAAVEITLRGELFIEGLDFTAETSNEVTAQNIHTLLGAWIPTEPGFTDLTLDISGAVITVRSTTQAIGTVTSSDPTNLAIAITHT